MLFVDQQFVVCISCGSRYAWTIAFYLSMWQVYIIGGDGTQKGASVIYEVT